MSVDTPATIVIVGAGPMGLEAALYARYLGYDAVVFEQNDVVSSLRGASVEACPTPFAEAASTLGVAALRAQDRGWQGSPADSLLDGDAWRRRYYGPLAQTDLLSDRVKIRQAVVRIEPLPSDDATVAEEASDETDIAEGTERADDEQFVDNVESPRLLVTTRDETGAESTIEADAVIIATGRERDAAAIDIQAIDGAMIHRLGACAHAGAEPYSMSVGLDQVRRLFARLMGRATLNLYAGFPPLD